MADAPATDPAISIVIPSHNRRELLCRVLDALAVQGPGTPPFEVIVVADGCRDGTQEVVAAYRGPFHVRLLEAPGVGPSKARNLGADHATADLLLFLDDDVIPTAWLVAAHAAAHRDFSGAAVLGPYPPENIPAPDPFRRNVQRWWKAHFDKLAMPGHRFAYTDLLTGNLSLRKCIWREVGGLDPQFARAREDLELGVRLMKRGVPFHYAPAALGWHQEHLTTSPRSMLHRVKEEGRSDALMAIKHPDMASSLAICRRLRRRGRKQALKLFMVRNGALLDRLILSMGHRLLALTDGLGLPILRRKLEHAMREFCYHRGAVEALGSGLTEFAQASLPAPSPPQLNIDLADGIDAAERELDRIRPASFRLTLHGNEVCILRAAPGEEAWKASHLRPYLARHQKRVLAPILASERYGEGSRSWVSSQAGQAMGTSDFSAQLREVRLQWSRGNVRD